MKDCKENKMELERLQAIVAELLDLDADKITPDASFKDDLGADSIDLVELHMALEDETGLTIPDEKLMEFKTVQDVLDYIKENA